MNDFSKPHVRPAPLSVKRTFDAVFFVSLSPREAHRILLENEADIGYISAIR